MNGQIYKAHTDSFWVKCKDELINVGVRGLFRKRSERPVVGDFVEIDGGVITAIKKRKNFFYRPNVANIDTVVIVVSPQPKPDFLLIDKLLVNALSSNLEVLFAVNKADVSQELFDTIKSEYSFLGDVFYKVSAFEGTGIVEFSKNLANRTVLFAGQSAVGKTSLVNVLFGLKLKTGELSEKILRGRHTTTYSEIHEFLGIKIIDTPGFAVIDASIKAEQLKDNYPDFKNIEGECKFRSCLHIDEPDCAIKKAVELGKISKTRYERYKQIYQELKEKEKNLYE